MASRNNAIEIGVQEKLINNHKFPKYIQDFNVLESHRLYFAKDFVEVRVFKSMLVCDFNTFFFYTCSIKLFKVARHGKHSFNYIGCLRWLQELFDGISFVQSKIIGHKHLTQINVYISDSNSIKIGDFGLQKDV